MDAFADAPAAPFRDARYAPARLEVQSRPNGELILANPAPVESRHATVNGPLDRWAAEAPDRIWLAERSGSGWRTLSYAEGLARVAALSGGLRDLGLTPERPLLVVARNSIEHALIAYAAMRIGCPAAPVSPQYGLPGARPERLRHAVELIRPGAVFVDDAALFAPALESCGPLAGVRRIAPDAAPGFVGLSELERGAPAPDLARGDQAAKLLLTSGSTGAPKAVICSHANMATNAAQIAACFEDDDDPPVMVNAAPWSHSLGANAILHMGLHRGGTLYIDRGQPTPERFGETLRNLAEVAPTYHNMVPAGWALFADALERDEALAGTFFSRVRLLQYGGASMPQSVVDRIQAVAVRQTGYRVAFASGYGSTETGPTACNVHWPNARSGLIGLPVPGTRLRLVPEGGRYELRILGPQVSPGYVAPDGGVQPLDLDEQGYFRIGDAARLADPDDPRAGLVFDGRLVENFKLSSGTFVAAGSLRVAALSAIGGAAADAVVCGEGRAGVGLLLFLNPGFCADLAPGCPASELARHPAVIAAIREGLARFNGSGAGGAGKVWRALILEGAPDAVSGEVTDKGYINQALARARRASEVERLFAADPDPAVLRLGA